MPDDDTVRRHRIQSPGRIDECFTFRYAACGGRDVDDVRGQSFSSNFKGGASAGGRFEKEVDDRLASQRRNFLYRPCGNFLKGLRSI